jgi:hypothetical protein
VQDRARASRAPFWAAGSTALGLSVAALALLGPMAGDVVRYRVAVPVRAQLAGSDVVAVGVIAPLALLAAVLSRRPSPVGPLLALGPALASWYLLVALVVGQDHTGRSADNAAAFLPLFVFVLLLASAVAIAAWRAVPRGRVVFDRPTGVLIGCLLLVLCVVDVLGRHLPARLGGMDGPGIGDYSRGPGFWWALAVLRLALLLPAAVAAAVGLLRRARWAGPSAFGLSGALALVALSATAGSVAAIVDGQARVTVGAALWLAMSLLVSVAPAAVCWLAVFRTGERAWRQASVPAGSARRAAPSLGPAPQRHQQGRPAEREAGSEQSPGHGVGEPVRP